MDQLFQALSVAASATNELQGHLGRSYGMQVGTVATEEDREDPMGLGRIRVILPSKGGKTKTDWLTRAEPMPGLHLPVPKVGDTVLVGYLDGDPHKGIYTAVAQNRINPAWQELDGLRLRVGQVELLIYPDGRLELTGLTEMKAVGDTSATFEFPSVTFKAETVAFEDAESVYINDAAKQVATIGATDDDTEGNQTDSLVTKGW